MRKSKNIKDDAASTPEAALVLERENVLVFQVTRPVNDGLFEKIEKRLRSQEEKTGVKLVLVPYSVKLKEE